MPRTRYKIITSHKSSPYFITSSIVSWIPVFGNPAIAMIIFSSLRFLQKENRLSIHAYVLMENHLHIIASSPALSKAIKDFKSYTARQSIDWYKKHNRKWILKQLHLHKKSYKYDQEFQFWQEGFHPKLIQTDAMLQNKLEYIHNNPVERGYITDPVHWRYSSLRNFMKLEAVLDIEPLV